MAMDDGDKWASQLLDELLEKLTKVDVAIASHTEKDKNKQQDISKEIPNAILKDIFLQETKTTGNLTSSSPLKYEEGSDIFCQNCETRDVRYEIPDESFKDKIQFQEVHNSQDLLNARACDKLHEGNHKSFGELSISQHKPAGTVETRSETDIVSEKKENMFDNSALDDIVDQIYDLWELKNKYLIPDNSENFLGKNLRTDIVDRDCFQFKKGNLIKTIDEINSGFFPNNLETEELYLQNSEGIEEKARSIDFSYQHSEDKNKNGDHGLLVESYYGHFDKKLTKEGIEYKYVKSSNSTESCLKTDNMPMKLNTEEYEKNGKVKIKSQGDGSITETENEKRDEQGDINKQGKDIDPEAIFLKRFISNAFEDDKEKCSDIKNENEKHFGLKNFKSDTDLIPLMETIALCSVIDSNFTTDIEVNAYPNRNESKDVPPRLYQQKSVKICHDVSDDPIITHRYIKVISVYRNACRAFENLFLIPIAIFIAESIDIITFVFFLSVCAFYMLYSNINIKINSFLNNKTNFIELKKRENLKEEKTSSDCNFLTYGLKNEIEKIYEFEENDSLSSFPFNEEEKETLENKIEISVVPEKVNVFNFVSEHAKQSLDDFYEKGGDFLENICKEHTTAVAKSYENLVVDIILKDSGIQSSNGDQMKVTDENVCSTDLNQNIMKYSEVICKSPKNNNSWNFVTLSNDTQDISNDFSENISSSNVTSTDHDESHLGFPILFDKYQGNIFNSTEIDSSVSQMKPKRVCKMLSPSQINIFDGLSSCISPENMCGNCLQSSSLNVNATSFSLISSSRSCSSSLSSYNMDSTVPSFQKGNFYIGSTRIRQESDIITMSNEKISDCSKNQSQSDESFFHTKANNSEKIIDYVQQGEPQVDDTEESLKWEIPESLPVNVGTISKYSNVSGHISTIDADEEQKSYADCEDSVIYDSPESLTFSISSENTYSEICFMDSDEMAESDTRVLKKKSSRKLRRRMSGIFNNLRAINPIQCAMLSANRQKKYKKQARSSDE